MASSVDITPVWCLQEATDHSARLFRRMLYNLTREGIGNVNPKTGGGMFDLPDDLKVGASSPAAMTVDIEPGTVFVLGDTLTPAGAQGNYLGYSGSTQTLDVSASDATNPRKDIVVAEFLDNSEDAGGSNTMRLRVIAGTPAGSPSEPATPSSAYKLATIDIAANATSVTAGNITDRRAQMEIMGVPRTFRRTGAKVTKSANQSIPNNTVTLVTWNQETWDTDAFHDTGSNTSRITIPTGFAGIYRFEARIVWAGQGTATFRELSLLKNGGLVFRRRDGESTVGADFFQALVIEDLASEGDYYEVEVKHTHGSSINVQSGSGCTFQARRVSD